MPQWDGMMGEIYFVECEEIKPAVDRMHIYPHFIDDIDGVPVTMIAELNIL